MALIARKPRAVYKTALQAPRACFSISALRQRFQEGLTRVEREELESRQELARARSEKYQSDRELFDRPVEQLRPRLYQSLREHILQTKYDGLLGRDPSLKHKPFRIPTPPSDVPEYVTLQKTSLLLTNHRSTYPREKSITEILSHMTHGESTRHSLQKLNMLARQIKGLTVDEALRQMKFSLKKPAGNVVDLLTRAVEEAEVERDKHCWDLILKHYGIEREDREYVIVQAWVGKQETLHGWKAHGKGMAGKITSDITRMSVIIQPRVIAYEIHQVKPNRGNLAAMPRIRHELDIRKALRPVNENPPLRNRFGRFFFD